MEILIKPAPTEYCQTLPVEECPLIHTGLPHIEQKKWEPLGSLNLTQLRHGIAADATHTYSRDGQIAEVHQLEDSMVFRKGGVDQRFAEVEYQDGHPFITKFDDTALEQMEGAYIPPVGPWWQLGSVMHINTSREAYYAYHDYPPHLQELIVGFERRALQYYQALSMEKGKGGVACSGKNNSAGCVFPSAGCQTVLSPHEQLGTPFNPRTFDQILDYRSNVDVPEAGLNRALALKVFNWIGPAIRDFSPDAQFCIDNLGYTIKIPGYQAKHFTPDAVQQFFRPLYLGNHSLMQFLNDLVFKGNLDDKINAVSKARQTDYFPYDKVGFDKEFYPWKNQLLEPPYDQLNQLEAQGKLRHHPSWSIENRVSIAENAGLFSVSFSLRDEVNHPFGPLECSGIRLNRPRIDPTPEAVQAKLNAHYAVMKAALAN